MSRAGRIASLALVTVALGACAPQPDHFYRLSTMPETPRPPAAGFGTRVILDVSLPSLVDRRQLTVEAPGERILVLEHERWAAPLTDLVTQTLARDIEQRRADVLVADRSFDRAGAKPVRIKVEVVRMSALKSSRTTLEAHWSIADPASQSELVGGETFTAPVQGDDYAAVARGFSACLAALADRLVDKLPLR